MAKAYKRGDDYKFYLNTGSYGSPTWTQIKAVADLSVDWAPSDIVIPESGIGDGHLQGYGDPAITFTLFEDTGDANVETLIAAMFSGAMKEIAAANGAIATTGTKFYRLEAVLTGVPLSVPKGAPASFAVTAKRHANSDYDLTRNTA